MHDGFAAEDHGAGRAERLAALADFPRDGRKHRARFPRLAVERRRQRQRAIAQRLRRGLRRVAEGADVAGDLRLHVMELLGRFRLQRGQDVRRDDQMIALDELLDVPARGTIRIARPGSDGIQRIAEHIAEHDGQHMRGRAALGKAAALDGGKMLANGVDLHDVRAAGQKLPCDLRAVVQRHAFKRLLKERRAAAGDQENHLVLRGHAIRQRQRRPRRRHAGLVRNRVSGLVDGHARDIALAVAVFGDDNALAEVLPQRLCRRVRHAPRGLSDGNHGNGAVKTPPFQRAVNGGVGQNRPNRIVNDAFCIFRHMHDDLLVLG